MISMTITAATIVTAVKGTVGGILDGGYLMEVNLVFTVPFRNFLVSVTAKILFPLNHYVDQFRCFLAVNFQNYLKKERKNLVHYF